jgi:hypothetical protein
MLSFPFQNGNQINIKSEKKAKWTVELMMEMHGNCLITWQHNETERLNRTHPVPPIPRPRSKDASNITCTARIKKSRYAVLIPQR